MKIVGFQSMKRFATMTATLLFFVGFAVPGWTGMKTDMIKSTDIEPGTYKVITYDRVETNDPVSIVLLQQEGSGQTVKFTSPGAVNVRATGLSADEAVRLGQNYIERTPTVQDTELVKVTSEGSVVGYEMRPVFMPLRYGSSDVVGTNYSVEPNRTLASVVLDPVMFLTEQGGG
jgi:hypothetical protein